MLESCVCERDWVKLLHRTLGLLPNACLPACPLFLLLILLLPKKRARGRREKGGKKSGFPTDRQTGQDMPHSAIFYRSRSPCCGHNNTDGFLKCVFAWSLLVGSYKGTGHTSIVELLRTSTHTRKHTMALSVGLSNMTNTRKEKIVLKYPLKYETLLAYRYITDNKKTAWFVADNYINILIIMLLI